MSIKINYNNSPSRRVGYVAWQRCAAISDIYNYLGDDRTRTEDIMRSIGNQRLFELIAGLRGVAGFPVQVWFEELTWQKWDSSKGI